MRKAKPKKRIILPDPKFNDLLVTKFVNNLMLQGKKDLAFRIFYDAIEVVSERSKEEGLEVWKKHLQTLHLLWRLEAVELAEQLSRSRLIFLQPENNPLV